MGNYSRLVGPRIHFNQSCKTNLQTEKVGDQSFESWRPFGQWSPLFDSSVNSSGLHERRVLINVYVHFLSCEQNDHLLSSIHQPKNVSLGCSCRQQWICTSFKHTYKDSQSKICSHGQLFSAEIEASKTLFIANLFEFNYQKLPTAYRFQFHLYSSFILMWHTCTPFFPCNWSVPDRHLRMQTYCFTFFSLGSINTLIHFHTKFGLPKSLRHH